MLLFNLTIKSQWRIYVIITTEYLVINDHKNSSIFIEATCIAKLSAKFQQYPHIGSEEFNFECFPILAFQLPLQTKQTYLHKTICLLKKYSRNTSVKVL